MKHPYRLSPTATANIRSLYNHIAADSEQAARDFVESLLRTLETISQFPRIGRLRPELSYLGRDLRSYRLNDYVVLYRIVDGIVQVVFVVNGYRNFENLLQP